MAAEEQARASASRRLQHDFIATHASALADNYLVVSLWPTKKSSLPRGVLAPVSERGDIDQRELEKQLKRVKCIVIPFVLDTAVEAANARRLVPQLRPGPHSACLCGVQLFGENEVPSVETNNVLLQRHATMYDAGVDQIIIGEDKGPEDLLLSLMTLQALWEQFTDAMLSLVSAQGDNETQACRCKQLQDVMWSQIPAASMPGFTPLDPDLVDTGNQIGPYSLITELEAMPGYFDARDKEDKRVLLKVTKKSTVSTPLQVEGIHREFRVLTSLKHPNVLRCLDMLHSPSSVALVLEYVGPQTLYSAISATPEKRLPEKVAMDCFLQLSRAVDVCHDADVAHRRLCFQNVAVEILPNKEYRYCLIEFTCALMSNTPSIFLCGQFPWMAPEMARHEDLYHPTLADLWGMGIILLELCGGMHSLANAVPFSVSDDPMEVAQRVQAFFSQSGSHEYALRFHGVRLARFNWIAGVMEMLLQVDPRMRSCIKDVLVLAEELRDAS